MRGISGYIKDYRQELESDIWSMPPLYHRVWQYLKYKVNHQQNRIPLRDGTFITLKPGEHLTSIRKIAQGVGYYERAQWKEPNAKTIKSILDWLASQHMISLESNSKYTVITLLNWEKYQFIENESNSKYTDGLHSMDTNKNDKECLKNDNNVVVNARARKELESQETDLDHIADYFMVRRGKPGQAPRASDYREIQAVLNSGVSVDEVLSCIDQAFEEFVPKYPGDEILSFGYCKKVILSNFYRDNARKEALNERDQQGNKQHYKQTRDRYEELSL